MCIAVRGNLSQLPLGAQGCRHLDRHGSGFSFPGTNPALALNPARNLGMIILSRTTTPRSSERRPPVVITFDRQRYMMRSAHAFAGFAALTIGLASSAPAQSAERLNPVIALQEKGLPVFGISHPAIMRGGRGGRP